MKHSFWKRLLKRRRRKTDTALAGIRPLFALVLLAAPLGALHAVDLALPTPNRALIEGSGPEYFQFVDRDFEGVKSYPWEGGQYGLVRSPIRSGSALVPTRFHEGIDIRPQIRDEHGIPADRIFAIADGNVAYVNSTPQDSNYGNYIVIAHRWDGCSYYSLYAHLRSASVKAGDRVTKGQRIGQMGWTGSGIDMRRAHLHFEVNFLYSEHFEGWYTKYIPNDPNRHGLYNGMNMVGVDPARLLKDNLIDPTLTIPAFLAAEQPGYKLAFSAPNGVGLIRRYPWLAGEKPPATDPPGWEITFNEAGVPLSALALQHPPVEPMVRWVSPGPHLGYRTRGMLEGTDSAPKLTPRGLRTVELLRFESP